MLLLLIEELLPQIVLDSLILEVRLETIHNLIKVALTNGEKLLELFSAANSVVSLRAVILNFVEELILQEFDFVLVLNRRLLLVFLCLEGPIFVLIKFRFC